MTPGHRSLTAIAVTRTRGRGRGGWWAAQEDRERDRMVAGDGFVVPDAVAVPGAVDRVRGRARCELAWPGLCFGLCPRRRDDGGVDAQVLAGAVLPQPDPGVLGWEIVGDVGGEAGLFDPGRVARIEQYGGVVQRHEPRAGVPREQGFGEAARELLRIITGRHRRDAPRRGPVVGWHRRRRRRGVIGDRKSTRLNSSHVAISYAVFCLKKK